MGANLDVTPLIAPVEVDMYVRTGSSKFRQSLWAEHWLLLVEWAKDYY